MVLALMLAEGKTRGQTYSTLAVVNGLLPSSASVMPRVEVAAQTQGARVLVYGATLCCNTEAEERCLKTERRLMLAASGSGRPAMP